jgi:hypothetical protein
MRRRRLLLIVMAATLLVIAGFALFRWLTTPAPPPGVTLENFRRLRRGMSLSEVEALLGNGHVEEGSYGWVSKDKDIAIYLRIKENQVTQGYVRTHDQFDMEAIRPALDNYPAVYHDERSYITFAIAVGVLALLLLLYRKRLKSSSSPTKAQ